MADNLEIFGETYPNATGIKAKDTNGVTQTFVKPSGTVNITSSGTTDVSAYANASVAAGAVTAPSTISGTSASVSTGTNTLTLSKTVSVTPTVTAGYVSSGTAGNSSVSLTANVTTKGAATITPSTTQQTIASGTYLTGTQTIAAMPSGTAGTPTASKGTVSNHSVSVTPSVTNTTGYITGGTKTGTAVSVSASELVSGTLSITSSGTKDVTNYASASVASMTLPNSTSSSYSGTYKASITPTVCDPEDVVTNIQYLNIQTGYNDTAQHYNVDPVVVDTLTVTENGTYNPASYDLAGFSTITVNVSGGGSKVTGTVTGNGSYTISFACSKKPDIVVIYRNDLQSPSAVTDRAHAASIIYSNIIGASLYTAASSTTISNSGAAKSPGIVDYSNVAANQAGYDSGYLYVRSGNNSNLWSTSLTYVYELYYLPSS